MDASRLKLPPRSLRLRQTGYLIVAVLIVALGWEFWTQLATQRARAWSLELSSLQHDHLWSTSRLRAQQFRRADWVYLIHEAFRPDSTLESWIRPHRGQLPTWITPLLPRSQESGVRWRALTFAWLGSQHDLAQRREDLLRLSLDAPDSLRWQAVDLATKHPWRPVDAANGRGFTLPIIRLLERFASDPDPRVRIFVACSLETPAPDAEPRVRQLLQRLAHDPDPAAAEAASRILARQATPP